MKKQKWSRTDLRKRLFGQFWRQYAQFFAQNPIPGSERSTSGRKGPEMTPPKMAKKTKNTKKYIYKNIPKYI